MAPQPHTMKPQSVDKGRCRVTLYIRLVGHALLAGVRGNAEPAGDHEDRQHEVEGDARDGERGGEVAMHDHVAAAVLVASVRVSVCLCVVA